MQLSMTVLRCPDQVAPEARTVSGGEFHVGRGPDVDWVLPDPDRLLSKRHFAVAFRGGAWQVADTSTNGTYLNTEPDAIGRGAPRSLRDGDRLRLGAYEIEVRLVDQPAQADFQGAGSHLGAGGSGFGAGSGAGGRSGQSPFGDPFAEDLLAPAPAARQPFDEPAYSGFGGASPSAQLPHDFDPLAPDRDESPFGGGFRGPVQSDHSSAMDDAMIAPIAGYASPQTGGIIPGDDLLPDDWDKDLLEGIGTPQAPPPQASPAQASPPTAPPPRAFSPPASPPPPPHVSQPQTSPPMPAPAAPHSPAPSAPPPFATPPFAEMAPPPVAPPHVPLEPLDFMDPLAPLASPEAAHPAPFAEPTPVLSPIMPAATAVGTAPVVRQRPPRPATGSAPTAATPFEADPFKEPEPRPTAARAQAPAPPLASPPAAVASAASPFDEPSDELEPAPVLAPVPAPRPMDPPKIAASAAAPAASAVPAPAVDDGSALAAFFKGAELSGATPADPISMMTGLGRAFRAMVSGLRAVLIARATIKSEFRIEQTMIRARGNNPLKFSANDDDALTALLGVGRRTDMAPAAAIEDSLRDLRMHEIATMAAMQVAVRALLDELSPDKIRAGTDQGGLAVLPAQRKARAWDTFEARHATVVQALVDDFDSIFGKSFARAYERALDEISTRERQ